MANYTVPGMDEAAADKVRGILQERLVALTDLHLTLKHIHWNVVGPNFIAVHEMIDPQVEEVRLFTDNIAERIATLGGEPLGTPGAIVRRPDVGRLQPQPGGHHRAPRGPRRRLPGCRRRISARPSRRSRISIW